MRKTLQIVQNLALVSLIFAVPAFGKDAAALTQAGCGPDKVAFEVKTENQHPIAQPEKGKSLVYVIEQEDNPGLEIGHITARVGVDGNWLGATHEKAYLSFSVDPGEHRICSSVQPVAFGRKDMNGAADLTAEAGQTYFYRVEVVAGERDRKNSLWLKPADDAEGMLLISRTSYNTSTAKK